MNLDKIRVANAFALSILIVWIICTAFIWILPDFSIQIATWWMHGMDVSVMGDWNLTVSNFLMGGIAAGVSAWATGWIVAWSWELVGTKR